VPLVGLVMGLGYAFFPIAFVLPFLAGPMALVLGFLVRVFARVSGLLDPVPFVSYRVPTPPAWVVVGYFAFLLLLLVPRRFRWQKPASLGAFAVFFAVLVTYPFPSRSSGLKVTVLDVGQGDAILVEFPGRGKMLIDAGGFPEGRFDVGESVVSPFLWRKGIRSIGSSRRTPIRTISAASPRSHGTSALGVWEAERPADGNAYAALDAALGGRSRGTVGGAKSSGKDAVIEVLNPAPGRAGDCSEERPFHRPQADVRRGLIPVRR
jgi:hypothetical protein